jgi:hypothetical protein
VNDYNWRKNMSEESCKSPEQHGGISVKAGKRTATRCMLCNKVAKLTMMPTRMLECPDPAGWGETTDAGVCAQCKTTAQGDTAIRVANIITKASYDSIIALGYIMLKLRADQYGWDFVADEIRTIYDLNKISDGDFIVFGLSLLEEVLSGEDTEMNVWSDLEETVLDAIKQLQEVK